MNNKQKIFMDMVLGILIYAVVLGFFEEYTKILTTWSYSTTFFSAIVFQILTFLTFWLKSKIMKVFKGRDGKKYVALLIFTIWLIMFVSKFIFLAVINFIFGGNVEISGFIGLIFIILSMTVIKKIIDIFYNKLT